MLNWALVFIVVALIALLLGFGGLVGIQIALARILFFVFLGLFAVTVLIHATRGRPR